MPPSAAAHTAVSAANRSRFAVAPARAPRAAMHFAGVPITETTEFPPAPAAQCWVYLTLNAEIALSLPHNPALQALVSDPRARVSVDGQWLWWALRRKYPQQPLVKLSGSDLIYRLAEHCAAEGRRLLLLGGHARNNTDAVLRLQERHPTLAVAGYSPPRYDLDDEASRAAIESAALEVVAAFAPDYVVLGLGAEKEQRLSSQLASRVDRDVTGILCFGGAIDMVSGGVSRAPRWMQICGVEGLYRVCQQPERLPRLIRVLRILPRLVAGRY
jgi:N-acetylglucosaminyldiphosphoundecaprenol N-acetyl-beta-D-mannosaminyltransferase